MLHVILSAYIATLLSKGLLHLFSKAEGWFLKGVCQLSRCWSPIGARPAAVDKEVASIALYVKGLANDREIGSSAKWKT